MPMPAFYTETWGCGVRINAETRAQILQNNSAPRHQEQWGSRAHDSWKISFLNSQTGLGSRSDWAWKGGARDKDPTTDSRRQNQEGMTWDNKLRECISPRDNSCAEDKCGWLQRASHRWRLRKQQGFIYKVEEGSPTLPASVPDSQCQRSAAWTLNKLKAQGAQAKQSQIC